ncbi:MAG: hypothetical protein LBC20_16695 [Planctomycetaceae bacterium]|nr:hypothetical protein [Planctomycetaceae bacterium]
MAASPRKFSLIAVYLDNLYTSRWQLVLHYVLAGVSEKHRLSFDFHS